MIIYYLSTLGIDFTTNIIRMSTVCNVNSETHMTFCVKDWGGGFCRRSHPSGGTSELLLFQALALRLRTNGPRAAGMTPSSLRLTGPVMLFLALGLICCLHLPRCAFRKSSSSLDPLLPSRPRFGERAGSICWQ